MFEQIYLHLNIQYWSTSDTHHINSKNMIVAWLQTCRSIYEVVKQSKHFHIRPYQVLALFIRWGNLFYLKMASNISDKKHRSCSGASTPHWDTLLSIDLNITYNMNNRLMLRAVSCNSNASDRADDITVKWFNSLRISEWRRKRLVPVFMEHNGRNVL